MCFSTAPGARDDVSKLCCGPRAHALEQVDPGATCGYTRTRPERSGGACSGARQRARVPSTRSEAGKSAGLARGLASTLERQALPLDCRGVGDSSSRVLS